MLAEVVFAEDLDLAVVHEERGEAVAGRDAFNGAAQVEVGGDAVDGRAADTVALVETVDANGAVLHQDEYVAEQDRGGGDVLALEERRAVAIYIL